jgi:predicted ATPase/class 3 adenylate cyclase
MSSVLARRRLNHLGLSSMPTMPEGTVTFLFTDVQGSTHAWEQSPELMMEALGQHDVAIVGAVKEHGGVIVKPRGEGDSRFIVFQSAVDAVAGVADIQRRLVEVDWVTPSPLLVRVSLHSGTAQLDDGDYYGSTVNRAARLRSIAHGGQTVISGATWELVQDSLPDGVTVRDMGEHGLKDLTRREHVYQLEIDGLENDFPALLSLDSVPNNLPEQLTEFVGRETELTEVTDLLGTTRLLTILAPGGSGKTRLAIQAAANLIDDYPDGVFFVALADINSGEEIVQTVAESLGIGLSADGEAEPQLLTYLAGKRQLLVFDNFEHVTEGASLIGNVLNSAPKVTIVATSREKLKLQSETTYTLAGLETDWDSPDAAMQTSGVMLFLDGASRTQPGFVLDADDLNDVKTILNLTGGLPLAILLAAAWVDMLNIREIAEEIEKSLDFLETEMGDLPDRHRSIRAVFEYSWSLLSEDEREVFAALSVFRGGFTRDAAGRVAGASLRSLSNLSNKSLVVSTPSTGRYAVHELLRQYAEQELLKDANRCREVQQAHADYFAGLMDEAASLFSVANHLEMMDIIETDIDNSRSALRHMVATKNVEGVHNFLPAFTFAYELRGWYAGGVALFGEVLDVFEGEQRDDLTDTVVATAKASQAYSLILIGQAMSGTEAAVAALDLLPESADDVDRLIVVTTVALGYGYLGRSDDMIELLTPLLNAFEELDNPFWASGVKNWLAFGYVLKGQTDTASALLSEAFSVFEKLNDHYFVTWTLWLQAMIATNSGHPEQSIKFSALQVERAKAIDYPRGSVIAQEVIGDANVAIEQFPAAEAAYVDSLRTAEQMGMIRDMLGLMAKLAGVRSSTGHNQGAVEMLATVCADPISTQQMFSGSASIRENATQALESIRAEMDESDYSAAFERGSATSFDEAVNVLLGRASAAIQKVKP